MLRQLQYSKLFLYNCIWLAADLLLICNFFVAASHVLIFLHTLYLLPPVVLQSGADTVMTPHYESGCNTLNLEYSTPESYEFCMLRYKSHSCWETTGVVCLPLTCVLYYYIALTTDWIIGCPTHCFYLRITFPPNYASSTFGKVKLKRTVATKWHFN